MSKNSISIKSEKVVRRMLSFLIGFDKWHVSPLKERPYAIDIISHCNQLPNRESYAEIGCGLGDIMRNVLFLNRYGYDADIRVLRAAKILPIKGKSEIIRFKEFHFPMDRLEETVDVLVMVNWIHHIDPESLRNKISQYLSENITPQGRIIIDTVQDSEYKFNHNIKWLTEGLDCVVELIGNYARQRQAWAIIKKT